MRSEEGRAHQRMAKVDGEICSGDYRSRDGAVKTRAKSPV
jgi:hypothetical protein